jgi:hypothetical protein
MKTLHILRPALLLISLLPLICNSQNVAINSTGNMADPSAGLDVNFTNKGMLVPRMTTTQLDSIHNPAIGLLIFNTTTNCFNVWLGATWKQICGDCTFPAPAASNNSPICAGSTLNLTASSITGATYSWTGPGFSSTQQNPSITNVTTAASGTYSLTATLNGCTSTAQTTIVTINSAPGTPGITNNGPLCVGQNLVLTTSAISGATYSWTGPSSFTANTQNATVSNVTTLNAGAYNLVETLNGCVSGMGSATPTIYASSPAQPGTISGPTVNLGSQTSVTYSISSVNLATTYAWTVPVGASITGGQGTTSITVNYTCSADGSIAVTAGNACGISPPSTLGVSTDLATPGSINGASSLTSTGQMTGLIYSISPIPFATSYAWTIPAGATITSGQGTDSITVNCPTGSSTNGTIGVTQTSACGTSAQTTLALTTTFPAPGTISGNTIVCPNSTQTYSITPVTNATSYTWTLPSGVSFNSGQGTNSISANVGTGSGNITVSQTSVCGTSGVSTLAINNAVSTFTFSPSTAIVGGTQVTFSPTSTFSGATYSWTFASGTPGTSTAQNPVVYWPAQTTTTSFNVTLSVNGCSATTNSVTVSKGALFTASGTGRTGTIENFTVPSGITSITIQALGAQGGTVGSYTGGLGASMQGTFTVTAGQVLKVLAGQQGTQGSYSSAGGGGGSFVTTNSNSPLIIAGGGGGAMSGYNGKPGLTTTSGGTSTGTESGGAGSNGGGGGGASSYGSAGGGGLLGNGGNCSYGSYGANGGAGGNGSNGGNAASGTIVSNSGGLSFTNGGTGGTGTGYTGTNLGDGGFGGGGAGGSGNDCGGGGGGYSGGAGSGWDGSDYLGGGGGSYILSTATNQSSSSGVQSGNGQVKITY